MPMWARGNAQQAAGQNIPQYMVNCVSLDKVVMVGSVVTICEYQVLPHTNREWSVDSAIKVTAYFYSCQTLLVVLGLPHGV